MPKDEDEKPADELSALRDQLKATEKERDTLKVKANRLKGELDSVKQRGSSDRAMLQEELDDAQRMIAAAMSGDTDGVVEEMKQQRDHALMQAESAREELGTMFDEKIAPPPQPLTNEQPRWPRSRPTTHSWRRSSRDCRLPSEDAVNAGGGRGAGRRAN